MSEDGHRHPVPPFVRNLSVRRLALRLPTLFAARLAEEAGGEVYVYRPGVVEVMLPGSDGGESAVVRLRIRVVNIYEEAAQAYRQAGRPVPERIVLGIERWNREHGR